MIGRGRDGGSGGARHTPLRSKLTIIAACVVGSLVCVYPRDSAAQLQAGSDFALQDCYAHLKSGQLIVGNSHVRRTWKIDHGALLATSLFDLDRKVEWINTPSSMPSPASPDRAEDSPMELLGGSGAFGPTESPSLRVELQQKSRGAATKYEFQVFPQTPGVRIWITEDHRGGVRPVAAAARDDAASYQADAIEHLKTLNPHLRFTQVTLRDQTDQHNELVFEDEWLLHPNEAVLELQGNIFILEDTLTQDGVIFLKEAPQPEMRPVKNRFDARLVGSETGLRKTREKLKNYFEISFYGNGLSGDGRGYASAMICYHGGRTGRIAALQRYQRQIRQYVPGRDGQLLSNTWGDRSTKTKLNEDFIRKEIDAGQRLGVDIVQIDDGWEKGSTIATAPSGGVWEGYRSSDPDFWRSDPIRFPNGFLKLSDYAAARGMRLGLWFAPDSAQDFRDWKKDADQLLALHSEEHIAAFKLDSVKLRSKTAETNYHALVDRVIQESDGKILLDLDVTAEQRQGYFGNIAAGPLFVENRYTDWHRYWPHQTLRNFWKLAQYVDPLRLRVEFLNPERNTSLYADDPLGPARYRPSSLFATTMFASPLGWFETSELSPAFVSDVSPLIAEWKRQREAIDEGTILPMGDIPDGTTWTGFASIAQDEKSGYLLAFRELNKDSHWVVPNGIFADGKYRLKLLGGQGDIEQSSAGLAINIPEPLGFIWVKVDRSDR